MRTVTLSAALALLCAGSIAVAQTSAAQDAAASKPAAQKSEGQKAEGKKAAGKKAAGKKRAANQQAAGAAKAMFNGTDLSGWRGRQDLWSVQDGAITGTTTDEQPIKGNTFLIWEGGKPANFTLTCQFKIEGGNSGIQYRSKVVDEADFVVSGYQADIDYDGKFAGINYEEKARGILALRGQRVTLLPEKQKQTETFGDATELGKVIRQGEWNTYRIVARGNRLQHYINDTLTAEVIDKDPQARSRNGVIALQLHKGPAMKVQFKDLQIQIVKRQPQK